MIKREKKMRTKLFLSFGLLAVCVLFIRFLLSVIVTKWHKQMKFLRKKRQHQFSPNQKPITAEKREVTDTINISENRWDRFLYTAVAHFTLVCVCVSSFSFPKAIEMRSNYTKHTILTAMLLLAIFSTSTPHAVQVFFCHSFQTNQITKKGRNFLFHQTNGKSVCNLICVVLLFWEDES